MSTIIPEVISETNLSFAWSRAFIKTMQGNKNNLMPLIVSVGELQSGPAEDKRIRFKLDATLHENGKCSSAISAMTIFPFKFWEQSGRPHVTEFSHLYLKKYLPRLRARDGRNRTGTYFERMVAFQGIKRKGGIETRNQLEHIIQLWPNNRKSSRPRQSALQVVIFDPVKDHNGSPRSIFPCLQQVSFAYDNTGGLAINAYYPAQYIFERAYGNYLGLCHLGYFVARELGLELVRLNCFIGRPELGDITKGKLRNLEQLVSDIIPARE